MGDQFIDTRTYVTKSAVTKTTTTNKKPITSGHIKEIIIENDTEHFDVERVDLSIGVRMRDLRAEKEWTQKDLAMRANVKVDVVRDYENGKAVPDNKILSKFEQVLGAPIRKPKENVPKPSAPVSKKK